MEIKAFFHHATSTMSYVLYDLETRTALIIDSALDFDLNSGEIWTDFADQQIQFIQERGLSLDWILETHVHADHISAAFYLRQKLGGRIGVSHRIAEVKDKFTAIFGLTEIESVEALFDCFFEDGDNFLIGSTSGTVIATPGHTPDSISYLIDGNLFVGDTLFMPDSGTARCDFPGGSAATLYKSVQRLYELPPETKVWVCHDYQPDGRDLTYQTTIKTCRRDNIHVSENQSMEDFINLRKARDAGLSVPSLIHPSLQMNIRGGRLPTPEKSGNVYLKIPLSAKGGLQ